MQYILIPGGKCIMHGEVSIYNLLNNKLRHQHNLVSDKCKKKNTGILFKTEVLIIHI